MKKKNSKKRSGTDCAYLASDDNKTIDYSDIPALEDSFWRTAQVRLPVKKESVTIRLDKDLLSWFRASGQGYQTRINAILRSYMKTALGPHAVREK